MPVVLIGGPADSLSLRPADLQQRKAHQIHPIKNHKLV
jgi:hypothetical protein